MVRRIYVEKRAGFDVPARQLLEDFRETLDVKLDGVRLLVRYDVEDLSDEDFLKVRDLVFREPNVDNFYYELPADLSICRDNSISEPTPPRNVFSSSRARSYRRFILRG